MVKEAEVADDPLALGRHMGQEAVEKLRPAKVEQTDEESREGSRAPRHTYLLADYGLTEGQVRERFAGL